jgi:hypothetical protein
MVANYRIDLRFHLNPRIKVLLIFVLMSVLSTSTHTLGSFLWNSRGLRRTAAVEF